MNSFVCNVYVRVCNIDNTFSLELLSFRKFEGVPLNSLCLDCGTWLMFF